MYLKNKLVSIALCAIVTAAGMFVAGNNTAYANPPQTTDPTIEQLQQMVNSLLAQIQQVIALIGQLKPRETCGNGICRFGETPATCPGDCAREARTDGYNHYCETFNNIKSGDVLELEYAQINDYYARYFMVSIDCPNAAGKRIYLKEGCETCVNGSGKYCYSGVGGSGRYVYKFTADLPGSHQICTWPSSDRESADSDNILTWKVKMSLKNTSCGNGVCETGIGETITNCAADCQKIQCSADLASDKCKLAGGFYTTGTGGCLIQNGQVTSCGVAPKCVCPAECVKENNTMGGETFTDANLQCCSGLEKVKIPTPSYNGTAVYYCRKPQISCTAEGNVLATGQSCCSGLKAINYSAQGSVSFLKQVCTNCGNGICGLGETNQNCPTDCDYNKLTCAQTCAQEGYPQNNSYCNNWTSIPGQSTNTCAAGEFGIGWTTDCNMAGANQNSGRTCCCNRQPSSFCGKTYNYDPSYNTAEVNNCKAAGGVIACSGSSQLSCYCNCNMTCKTDASQKSCLKYLAIDGSLRETNHSSICAKELQVFKGCDQSCKPIVECGSAPVCGDQSCDSGETAVSCPADCITQDTPPDLVVKDVFYQPACGLYVTYCNIGKTSNSQTFLIKTKSASGEYGGNYYYPFSIPAAGQCKTTGSMTIGLIGVQEGEIKEITATVDWQNTVREANDNNNTLAKTIQFIPAQGNCNYSPTESTYN